MYGRVIDGSFEAPRARSAWGYSDGTFMPQSEKSEACIAEYGRYALGGRALAERARGASIPTIYLTAGHVRARAEFTPPVEGVT